MVHLSLVYSCPIHVTSTFSPQTLFLFVRVTPLVECRGVTAWLYSVGINFLNSTRAGGGVVWFAAAHTPLCCVASRCYIRGVPLCLPAASSPPSLSSLLRSITPTTAFPSACGCTLFQATNTIVGCSCVFPNSIGTLLRSSISLLGPVRRRACPAAARHPRASALAKRWGHWFEHLFPRAYPHPRISIRVCVCFLCWLGPATHL